MRNRLFALVLALALLCSLMAGCGKTETSAPASEQAGEAASAEAPAAEAPAAEAESSEPAQAAEGDASKAEDEVISEQTAAGIDEFTSGATHTERADIAGTYNADGSYTSTGGITYPIADELIEVNQWNAFGMFDQGIDTYNDLPRLGMIADATGVKIHFMDISSSAESEQFQLAVASESLPEICTVGQLYTGGIAAAYSDEVIWDLTDYVPDYAPDWLACLNLSTEATIDNAYNNGMILQICGIAMAYEVDQGLFTNGKFLKQYNAEQGFAEDDIKHLQSLDGFTSYLKWIKDAINPTYVSILDSTGAYTDMGNAFGTSIYSIGTTGIGTYLEGDTVVAGISSQGYYDYLKWVGEMYSYGVFDQDFYLTDMAEQEEYMYIGTGQEGVWNNTAASQKGVLAYTDSDGEHVVSEPLSRVLNDEGTYNFGTEQTLAGDAWSVTTTADEDVMQAILQYWNYFFTEPGFYVTNWGIEGTGFDDPNASYYFNDDGEAAWTSIVINSDDTWMMWKSTWKLAPYYEDPMVHYMTGEGDAAEQLKAVNVWTYPDYEVTTEHTIPTGAALTTEESSQVATLATDLCTYADERILKFIIGSEELTEDSWADFCGVLENSYSLSEIVSVYQFAYDDYLAGNRTSAASAGPGAPPPPPDGGGAPPDAPPPA